MKMISFDLETAGLEPGKHSILEFGAVIDDFETPVSELPTFRRLIKHDDITGQHYALGMHVDSGILEELQTADPEKDANVSRPEHLSHEFARFLYDNGFNGGEDFVGPIGDAVREYTFTAAGKNVASFDIPHVETLEGFGDFIQFHHRVLDPGPMYFDPEIDDVVPDLSTCLERAGLDTEVRHTGVEDSKDVVRLIRKAKGVPLE